MLPVGSHNAAQRAHALQHSRTKTGATVHAAPRVPSTNPGPGSDDGSMYMIRNKVSAAAWHAAEQTTRAAAVHSSTRIDLTSFGGKTEMKVYTERGYTCCRHEEKIAARAPQLGTGGVRVPAIFGNGVSKRCAGHDDTHLHTRCGEYKLDPSLHT